VSRNILGLVVILATSRCQGDPTRDTLPAGGHHILFVGNSLTYTNDLPATVAAIARDAGDTIRVRAEAGPNLALIDHLNGATAAAAVIAAEAWEYVILQQGPTPAGICRDSLVLWTTMFDPLVRASGGTTALLMPWTAKSQMESLLEDVRVSFEAAAAAVGGVFIPAGEAWRIAQAADPTLGLWGSDNFHPGGTGTFLTALVVYERVTGHDARNLPARAFAGGAPFPLEAATVRLLQRAAHDANEVYPARPVTTSGTGPAPSRAAAQC
jgi:hypothetical protein